MGIVGHIVDYKWNNLSVNNCWKNDLCFAQRRQRQNRKLWFVNMKSLEWLKRIKHRCWLQLYPWCIMGSKGVGGNSWETQLIVEPMFKYNSGSVYVVEVRDCLCLIAEGHSYAAADLFLISRQLFTRQKVVALKLMFSNVSQPQDAHLVYCCVSVRHSVLIYTQRNSNSFRLRVTAVGTLFDFCFFFFFFFSMPSFITKCKTNLIYTVNPQWIFLNRC